MRRRAALGETRIAVLALAAGVAVAPRVSRAAPTSPSHGSHPEKAVEFEVATGLGFPLCGECSQASTGLAFGGAMLFPLHSGWAAGVLFEHAAFTYASGGSNDVDAGSSSVDALFRWYFLEAPPVEPWFDLGVGYAAAWTDNRNGAGIDARFGAGMGFIVARWLRVGAVFDAHFQRTGGTACGGAEVAAPCGAAHAGYYATELMLRLRSPR